MTREEAIKTIKENCCAMCAYASHDMDSCDIRGCDNKDAIKVLEQEPVMPVMYYPQVEGITPTVVEPCTDAVSRQAVLDLAKFDGRKNLGSIIHAFDVEQLPPVKPAEKPNKWIACSDRLPEAGEYIGNVAKYYLVQNEYGDMLVARYTHGEYWEQIYQLKPIGDEIVAWMPLPKSYVPDTNVGDKAESEG